MKITQNWIVDRGTIWGGVFYCYSIEVSKLFFMPYLALLKSLQNILLNFAMNSTDVTWILKFKEQVFS